MGWRARGLEFSAAGRGCAGVRPAGTCGGGGRLVTLNVWPFASGGGVDRQLGRKRAAAWTQAARGLDRTMTDGDRSDGPGNGQLLAYYDWGGPFTTDPARSDDKSPSRCRFMSVRRPALFDLQWTGRRHVSKQRAARQLRPPAGTTRRGRGGSPAATTDRGRKRRRSPLPTRPGPGGARGWTGPKRRKGRVRAAAHGAGNLAQSRTGRRAPLRHADRGMVRARAGGGA